MLKVSQEFHAKLLEDVQHFISHRARAEASLASLRLSHWSQGRNISTSVGETLALCTMASIRPSGEQRLIHSLRYLLISSANDMIRVSYRMYIADDVKGNMVETTIKKSGKKHKDIRIKNLPVGAIGWHNVHHSVS